MLALDCDPARRAAFLRQARGMPTPVSGLQMAEYQLGDLAMVWWRGKHAPWSDEVTAKSVAALAGHAIDDGGRWLDAAQMSARWLAEVGDVPSEPLDGYHVATVYEPAKRLILGTDLLGFFPVYYWNEKGVLLATSSCRLLAAHPVFQVNPDLQGIVGMLMINGLVAKRTLLAGVRRLSPGHRLIVESLHTNGYAAREQLHFCLAGSDRFAKSSLDELVEASDAMMRRVIKRHTPPGSQTTQLASGGLDSRLVTAYIKESAISCTGICLGRPSDFEAQAAIAAAKILEFPLQLVPDEADPSGYVERTVERVDWLQLSAGIGSGELTDALSALGDAAPCFWSGISLDDVFGGNYLEYGFESSKQSWTGRQFAKDTAKWGLDPQRLARLCGPSGGKELVELVRQLLEREFDQHDDSPHRLVFRARLANRHRYHLGNIVWQLSFASWPLLFVADRKWLEMIFDLPPAVTMKKSLEMELLRRKFPQLLAAPLDVNSWHHGWIDPSRTQKLRLRLNKILPIERLWHDWYWRRWRGTDRRRYWRFYDFDGPNWRAVRRSADPLRGLLHSCFDRQEIDRLLPAPLVRLPKNNAFGDVAARRNLLGLSMWLSKAMSAN